MSRVPSVIVVEPDPALAVAVEDLLSAVHPTPDLVAVADVDELRDWARPTGVVVAGPSCASRQDLAALTAFRDQYPAVRIVLAFDRRPGSPMRDVVAIGADALVDPTEVEDLRAAVVRALDLAERLAPATEPDAAGATAPLGDVWTVCSATGGCGKTFYATNVAFALAKLTGQRVALVDLDLQFGEVLTALRVRAQHTISDVIAITDDAALREDLPEMMTAHESGLWVLPAPLDPAEADRIEPRDVVRVIDLLREHYDHVVVDNPTGLGETTLAALDRSTHLFVLAALDLSSVRNLRLFLQTLDRLQIPQDDVSLVLNKDQPGVGIEAGDVERLFSSGFRSRIPFSREVPRSMNSGMPVVGTDPKSAVSSHLVSGIVDLLPEEFRASAIEQFASGRSLPWYRRLLTRRAATATTSTPVAHPR